ncbi:hypothetical protein GE09DRAFT_1221149 [Coniochaeta sp. 2T2.1]|nr:hypothetical protein GE09DRAFT_1221149 [Coniochaeta sp. 2T2.1]
MDDSHMAGSSSMGPSYPDPSSSPRPENLELMMPDDNNETPSPPSEGTEDEDLLYGDGDDAQSFIQPAISPVATRLTSPKVLVAERAAAMARLEGGTSPDGAGEREMFGPRHTNSMPTQSQLQGKKVAGSPPGADAAVPRSPTQRNPGAALARLPSPWHPGAKEFVIDDFKGRKPVLSGVFGSSTTRSQRASSIGDSAMRRLSKAFDSVNLPNFTSSSFFSSTNKDDHPTVSSSALTHSRAILHRASKGQTISQPVPRPGQEDVDASRSSLALQRTLSDDSALYHSLSRVSSYGDDERWTHIREQVNIRMKAIKDSWDAPTFKLPNLFPDSLKLPSPNTLPPSLPPKPKGDGLYPSLDRVLESLTGDIVILGGYRGSVLRSSHPPHRQLWVPVKVGLNIRKVNLEVGLDPQAEEDMEAHIFASGMLQNIGPVDISKRLFKRLRECDNARSGKLRVHDYGYDWRLSPHLLSRKLVSFLETLPSNNQPGGVPSSQRGALVIAHSLGGLITRHAVNARPDLFSGVLYAGAPQRCINILGPVRNGDAVLLNEKVLTAQVNFSLRTTFVFLPEDGFCFVDKFSGESYPIDFYDVEDWIKYRLSPMVSEPPLPPLLPPPNKTSGGGGTSTFGPLRSISGSLALRNRSNSEGKKSTYTPTTGSDTVRKAADTVTKDRTLAPQLGSSSSPISQTSPPTSAPPTREQNIAYLRRTLHQTKLFRRELQHNPHHQASNAYPPISVLYGKDIPTVYAARVAGGRAAIPCADAYDDLLFHSGDGVVLAREAMPPAGYEIVRGGRVSSDRGHITLLGDLEKVGRALEAVVRGRRRGIGLGVQKEV